MSTPEARMLCDMDRLVERCQIVAAKLRKGERVKGDVLSMREITETLLENAKLREAAKETTT